MTEKEKKTLREAILIMERLLDEGQTDLFGDTLSNQRRPPRFKKPTKEEVTTYFVEQGYTAWRGAEMWDYYEGLNWCNSKGKNHVGEKPFGIRLIRMSSLSNEV